MTTQCPKCKADNPETKQFCGDCGTQLTPAKEIPIPTQTIEAPREELTTGSTFAGRYQIIEELGKGGMGKVYKAHDSEIREKVALKLLKPEISADNKTIERFQNELKFSRKIGHRNVCRMYDLNKEEGNYYITMEYIEGQDLKGLIRQAGQLTVGKSIFIAKQVCDGLAEAHRLGVVHRDLKPQNIMIDREGNARIMDFGIARSISEKGITGAGVMIGTPEYMSPEQAEAKEVDKRSDIYSLGVIMYEMLTGRVPFEGDTALSIAMKHKGEIPKDPKELNPQIPDDLNRIILRCMEKDKAKRYQNVEDLLSELDTIEKGMPTTEKIVPKRKPLTSKEITVTFGVKKLLIPALVLLAIIIAGMIFWRFVLKGKPALLPSERHSIAVISFKNQTGDQAYNYLQDAIPNLLITSLEQSGYFQVATWERLHDLLKQMGKKDVEVIDEDLGFELCRMEGIDAIVLGSFVKAGEMFATDVKVLDAHTKSLLKSASARGEGEGSILKSQIDELSTEISRGIGIPESRINSSQIKIADYTTSSMEAYNYFLRGRDDWRKFLYEDARRYLEKAVELDPTFAFAHLYLALTYNDLGYSDLRDEAYEKAKANSEKTTEKERLFIDAAYAYFVGRDSEKFFRLVSKITQRFPKEKQGHYWLGLYYQIGEENFEKAIEEYTKVLELDPDYGYGLNQMAYAHSDLGNYEKAIEYLQRYTSVSPGDPNPLDSMAELYFTMGRIDEALEKYKEALEVKPDFYLAIQNIGYVYAFAQNHLEALRWFDRFVEESPTPGTKAEAYAWRGFYLCWLGQQVRAMDDFEVAAELAESVGNKEWIGHIHRILGWVYYDQGNLKLSREHFKEWLDVRKELRTSISSYNTACYNFYLGLVDLKEGQFDSARSKLDIIQSHLPDITSNKDMAEFYHDFLLGELLLAEGSIEEAIRTSTEASSIGAYSSMYVSNLLPHNFPFEKDTLARAYLKVGDIDKAIVEYKRLITFDPNTLERSLVHPRYYYKLAKLYEQKGQKAKAIEHYEKFLELWKDADPGIFEVEDARERLMGLL
ncbi:MAG: protein kinase [Candidatus Aminicenantes bacterium]|jgi:serine/threonine protein kinase/Tfp pilus assembly protein PilF